MQRFLALLLLLLAVAPLSAQAEDKPLKVTATFSILGYLVKQVGGDLVQVKTLVGPNGDAHSFQPTPQDSILLSKADMIVENGLGFEGWIDRLVTASGFKGPVVIASKGVKPRQMDADENEAEHGHHHEEGGKISDPHAWQNIANTRIYVKNIANALIKAMPEKAAAIEARAKAYDAELAKLDSWVKAELAPIPENQRKIITSHDAFGYFGSAYGVSFLSPQGISTEAEPTAAQIARLIEQMKVEKIHRVFFETLASPRLITQLGKDAGASVGKPVYSDSLSAPNGPASTYTSMIRHNVELFVEAMKLNGK